MKRIRFYVFILGMIPLALASACIAFGRQDEYIDRIWGEKLKAAGRSTVHDDRV